MFHYLVVLVELHDIRHWPLSLVGWTLDRGFPAPELDRRFDLQEIFCPLFTTPDIVFLLPFLLHTSACFKFHGWWLRSILNTLKQGLKHPLLIFLLPSMLKYLGHRLMHYLCVEEHRSLGGSIIIRLDNGAFFGLIYSLLVFSWFHVELVPPVTTHPCRNAQLA